MEIKRKGRTWWSCIYPVLIYFLCQTLAYIGVIMVYSFHEALGMDLSKNYDTLINQMMNQMMGQIDTLYYVSMLVAALIAIPVFLRMYLKDRRVKAQDGNVKTYQKIPIIYYLIVIGLGVFAALAGNNMITMSGIAASSESFMQVNEVFFSNTILMEIIGMGILIPVAEELLFRGIIYRRLCDLMPMAYAIGVSALIFAFLHGNIVQGIYAFFLGILFCLVYERFHHIFAPILMHAFANLISIILSNTKVLDFMYTSKTVFYLSTAVLCLLVVGMVWLLEMYVYPLAVEQEEEKKED